MADTTVSVTFTTEDALNLLTCLALAGLSIREDPQCTIMLADLADQLRSALRTSTE